MCEPPWWIELAQIQKDEEIHYIASCSHGSVAGGSGRDPGLDFSREFNLSQEMKETVDLRFALVLGYNVMSIGEMQALKALITLQCLAEAGPRRPALGYICQCIESIMCPMMAIGIALSAHAVLASVAST